MRLNHRNDFAMRLKYQNDFAIGYRPFSLGFASIASIIWYFPNFVGPSLCLAAVLMPLAETQFPMLFAASNGRYASCCARVALLETLYVFVCGLRCFELSRIDIRSIPHCWNFRSLASDKTCGACVRTLRTLNIFV